ncbi:mucin-3B-like isoform X2 [Hyla sarda]|uniref:mucin-3B-like isoform X2 n=1 Tax=Hyla sarda TaxID=327740 RepID=UPI0024C2A857|nr:mucin-3B-like isoform X2 [Hyla sarda]
MDSVYKNIPGYKGVEILSIRPGSIIVDHKVIAAVEIKKDVNVTEECEKIFKDVGMSLEENKDNCTGNLCISEVLQLKPEPAVTLVDFCSKTLPAGFSAFYTPLITSEGLTCVSYCDQESPKYVNCNNGICNIKKDQGPLCLCPDIDQYIYTSSDCAGRLSKSGVYGGIGAAIVLLAIMTIAVSVFLFRERKKRKAGDQYDESTFIREDEENIQYGFSNPPIYSDEEEYHQCVISQNIDFNPSLEKVDMSLKVKIKRPDIIYTSSGSHVTS